MLPLPLLLGIGFVALAVYGSVLVDFQVAQPPVVPQNAKQCTLKVLQPPTHCGPVGSWAAITLNLTVTSNGTQYDRLGHFTFQNVETTVYVTYYASSEDNPPAKKADLIIPLSTLANNTGDEASVPPSFSTNITLPTNTVKVFAEILASGNAQEEFWYANAANQFLSNLPDGTTYGQGPFREVRLLIDGKIAGAALPYPVIFTGGLAPSLWRPIAAYGALDLPSCVLDVTPFIPLLVDGNPHEFTIDVVSAEHDHAILQNWYVSGVLHVVTHSSSKPTTGKITTYDAPLYAETEIAGTLGQAGTVSITVKGSRKLHVEAEIISGSGELTQVVWSQELDYSNIQLYSDNATVQLMTGGNYGNGTSNNTFSYTDSAGNYYTRQINAALNVITFDQEGGNLARWHSATSDAVGWKPSVQDHSGQVRLPGVSAEVVQLSPPTDCGTPGSWAAVTLNFTVTSNGTQFDRLVWRTSTPEPTRGDGIIWTYIKDVTQYIPLFAKPGIFILQLDNLIQPGLDGVYSGKASQLTYEGESLATLQATYYSSSAKHPEAPRSDLIVPLSTFANNTGNDASVPPGFSLNVTLPQNVISVFAELYASGNGAEEFWYFNVDNEFLSSLSPGSPLQQGPFREVRILVDGHVAGVAFPYATIFTGGIAPPAWRPITSYGALDLPTYFIDLTPFVPVFANGEPHNITIDVASAEDDHSILQNWFVSGLLQVYLDTSPKRTTGEITSYSAQPFASSTTSGKIGENGDINVTVTATRKIHVEANIVSGSGELVHAVWLQDLQYVNVQNYLEDTTIQNVVQVSSGQSTSYHNNVLTLIDNFSYPVGINLTFLDSSGDNFVASFNHSYNRDLLPFPARPRSNIFENQLAVSFFDITPSGNSGNGTSSNVFDYSDSEGNTYHREVSAALNKITSDLQTGSLATHPIQRSADDLSSSAATGFAHARLPRGPERAAGK
ncbi:hypothetical protein H0H93_001552 [Arthromyces matolae]|nr:hypothetical protein H0H93_001552 [Arthromyces matolae]